MDGENEINCTGQNMFYLIEKRIKMTPEIGDVVFICDRHGNKTQNYTFIGVVWEQHKNLWYIHDKFAVPMRIKWTGENWLQCIEKQSEI